MVGEGGCFKIKKDSENTKIFKNILRTFRLNSGIKASRHQIDTLICLSIFLHIQGPMILTHLSLHLNLC